MKDLTTVKEVRHFLVLCGFYRKHVPSFAKIAAPLTNLTRTNTTFKQTEQSQQSFEQLKACLMNTTIVKKSEFNPPFLLTTDVNNTHVGGVLSQIQFDGSNKPIGYISVKIIPCEYRYSLLSSLVETFIIVCEVPGSPS